MENTISFEYFHRVEIRLGTIIKAEEYKELNTPSIVVEVDFG